MLGRRVRRIDEGDFTCSCFVVAVICTENSVGNLVNESSIVKLFSFANRRDEMHQPLQRSRIARPPDPVFL